MKKSTLTKLIGSISIIIIACIITTYGFMLSYLKPASPKHYYSVKQKSHDTLKIGIIGDSWANIHEKYNDSLKSYIQSIRPNQEIKIISSGKGGAKSKLVYMNMFEDHDEKYNIEHDICSSMPVIKENPQYCVVFVGINDVVTKVGSEFYVKNTALIIDHLLHHNITPILIEIPSVNYKMAHARCTFRQKAVNKMAMYMTGTDFDCLNDYRDAMDNYLNQSNLDSKIIYIRSKEWSPDGYNDTRHLFGNDGVHMNHKGYSVIDHCIADKIVSYIEA